MTERVMWVYICDDWIDGWIPVFLDDEPEEEACNGTTKDKDKPRKARKNP